MCPSILNQKLYSKSKANIGIAVFEKSNPGLVVKSSLTGRNKKKTNSTAVSHFLSGAIHLKKSHRGGRAREEALCGTRANTRQEGPGVKNL
jgi:hypothetical protein